MKVHVIEIVVTMFYYSRNNPKHKKQLKKENEDATSKGTLVSMTLQKELQYKNDPKV